MGKLLYCKNKPCYDIENNQVLDSKLVPYYILKDSSITRFNQWIKLKYSTGSNTFARMLRGITFGQGNRQLINEKTFMLSYSDCYWVKDENNTIRFEDMIREFGIEAVRMFAIDAIIGNGDRHAGNFGFLQDANTGEVLGMSPLFDFDHALDDSKEEVSGYLLSTLMNLNNTEYIDEVLRITNKASNFSRTIFAKRAQNLKDKILNRYKNLDVVNRFEW